MALKVMNECIFMYAQTHIHTYVNTFNPLMLAVHALILIVQNSIPVQGIFSKPPMACQSLLSITVLSALLSDLCAHEWCVLMLSVSSKKAHATDTLCIHFQMEGVKACSATVPVCFKSAKAL